MSTRSLSCRQIVENQGRQLSKYDRKLEEGMSEIDSNVAGGVTGVGL